MACSQDSSETGTGISAEESGTALSVVLQGCFWDAGRWDRRCLGLILDPWISSAESDQSSALG